MSAFKFRLEKVLSVYQILEEQDLLPHLEQIQIEEPLILLEVLQGHHREEGDKKIKCNKKAVYYLLDGFFINSKVEAL